MRIPARKSNARGLLFKHYRQTDLNTEFPADFKFVENNY